MYLFETIKSVIKNNDFYYLTSHQVAIYLF